MESPWQTSDFLDLDYFLHRSPDQSGDNDTGDSPDFDRAVYLTYAQSHNPPFERGNLIKYWLDEKRAAFAEKPALPGELFNETMSLMRILAIITAFIFGVALSWSVLSYSGTTPINIFTCIWVMIVPQLLLLGLLGLSALLSKIGVKNTFRGFYTLIAILMRRLADRTGKTGHDAFQVQTRQRLNALVDLARHRNTPYGKLLFWPFFFLAQLFAIWFNLGLLVSTGLKLAITDLAFGWQSTLFPDPAMVLRMVEFFSRPWSWAVTDAHPTLSQIEGSRMILKEGIVHLTTPDLVSWWPFLVYAILCYGLAPRILLLAWGHWKRHRILASTRFSTGACDRLIQRLQTPRLRTAESAETDRIPVKGGNAFSDSMPPCPDSLPTESMGPAIVLVPEEIAHLFDDDALKDRISVSLGLDMTGRMPVEQDPDIDQKALKNLLAKYQASPDNLRLVIVTEAWQPPLGETISWLAGLRQAVGPHTGIIIGLIGKPMGNDRFISADRTDWKIWEQAINSLKDPFTRIENLGGGHG